MTNRRTSFKLAEPPEQLHHPGGRREPQPFGEVGFPQVEVDQKHLLPSGGGEIRGQVHRRDGLPFPGDGAGDRDDLASPDIDGVFEPGGKILVLLGEELVLALEEGVAVRRFRLTVSIEIEERDLHAPLC